MSSQVDAPALNLAYVLAGDSVFDGGLRGGYGLGYGFLFKGILCYPFTYFHRYPKRVASGKEVEQRRSVLFDKFLCQGEPDLFRVGLRPGAQGFRTLFRLGLEEHFPGSDDILLVSYVPGDIRKEGLPVLLILRHDGIVSDLVECLFADEPGQSSSAEYLLKKYTVEFLFVPNVFQNDMDTI